MVKKRTNLPNWLCFTAKRREDYSIQRLRHVIVSRQSSHSMTSCPQQIAVPFAVCIFVGFGEIAARELLHHGRRVGDEEKTEIRVASGETNLVLHIETYQL